MVEAKGTTKQILVAMTLIVGSVTIITHLKNMRKNDKAEGENNERLTVLEEKVAQLEKKQ